MPIPVIAGMPWLAGLIAGLFSSLISWFASFLTKRLAIVAAGVAVLVVIVSAFMAALLALINGLAIVVPDTVSLAASLVIPSNTPACISAYLTARVARWAYDWNINVLHWKMTGGF